MWDVSLNALDKNLFFSSLSSMEWYCPRAKLNVRSRCLFELLADDLTKFTGQKWRWPTAGRQDSTVGALDQLRRKPATVRLSGTKLGFWNYSTLAKTITHDVRSREQRADSRWGATDSLLTETGMLVFPCFQLRLTLGDGGRVAPADGLK